MVFSSVTFLVYFLPALLLVYFAVRRDLRNPVLLVFSLIFYGWGGPEYLALLLASVAVNYVCGLAAGLSKRAWVRRGAVVLACVSGLGLLGYFKYFGFAVSQLNALGLHLPVPEIVLPIGISFYTFQGLSYVIDVYRGSSPAQKNPLDVALYVALFPQLVAGPIVRYSTVASDIRGRSETAAKFASGAVRFCFGLGKKMLLANALGEAADAAFGHAPETLGALQALLGIVAYTGQIYFDFSAYSDMAIGLGRIFGFEFPENFNYPYVSKSVTEFWRRWHISLSTWFRDYVYIPLGGSRRGRVRNFLNLAAVWLLTGLWHGANWTFVLWGAWFLLLLAGERYVWGRALERLPSALRHIYAMAAVMVGWIIFRAPSVTAAGRYIAALFGANRVGAGEGVYTLLEYMPQLILGSVAALPLKDLLRGAVERRTSGGLRAFLLELAPAGLALCVLALSYMKLATGSFNPFIYFQF